MDIGSLSGIVVVIDDEVESQDTNVFKLVQNIKEFKLPCLTYTDIPDLELVPHLSSAPFIVLDWQLYSSAEAQSQELVDGCVARLIDFMKNVKQNCFCPIFLYTNSGVDDVEKKLRSVGLIDGSESDAIIVKSKSELAPENVIEAFNQWASENPTVHTLLTWEKTYERAKNSLFGEFYQHSPAWPKVLWDTYASDGADASEELGGMITRNLHSRMQPFRFDDSVFHKAYQSSRDELRSVLAGEKFLECKSDDAVRAGDIFKIGNKHYINVRPDCDCISRNGEDDFDLYLLRARLLSPSDERRIFREPGGNFEERADEAVVFNMVESKTAVIKFKDIAIKQWNDCSSARIGRLLPPYITRVVQRYSLYLQRVGLPKIPEGAVNE